MKTIVVTASNIKWYKELDEEARRYMSSESTEEIVNFVKELLTEDKETNIHITSFDKEVWEERYKEYKEYQEKCACTQNL